MKKYEFIDRETLENMETIRQKVKQKYGIVIDEIMFKSDRFQRYIKEIFEKRLRTQNVDNLLEELNDILEEKEINSKMAGYLREVVARSLQVVCSFENYENDLMLDTYMGILLADEQYDVKFNDDMENVWNMKRCNKNMYIDKAKQHYPYATEKSFEELRIPGGCEEYHALMISQSNIGIFDIDKNVTTLQRYAFPKTYDIYIKLEKTPAENLLLLEKTLGIGYTNQVYHYIKEFIFKEDKIDKEKLNSIILLIKKGLEIEPIFLRKTITDIFLRHMNYSEYSAPNIEEIIYEMENIVVITNKLYRDILEFGWYIYWLAYKKGKIEKHFYSTGLFLKQELDDYINMDKMYEDFIKTENLHDWRNIESVDDCFKIPDSSLRKWLNGDVEKIWIKSADDTLRELLVMAPLGSLGKEIKMKAIEELERMIELPEDDKQLGDLYYKKKEEIFDRIKKREERIWKSKDPKSTATKVKPLHIYAMIHAQVVKGLNS